MIMSDVIKVLGNTPLKEFPWGCVVRDTVNLFAIHPHRLTEESTGADVQAALDALPEENRVLVMKASIDPNRRCTTTPVGGGMVVEHIDRGETADADLTADTVALQKAMLNPQFLATCLFVGLGVTMSGYMVSTLAANKDFKWGAALSELFGIFGFKLFGG